MSASQGKENGQDAEKKIIKRGAADAASFSKAGEKMDTERKEIRFIDSRYRELFRIQDGDSIEISFPNGEKVESECTFLDEYHTMVGTMVFHICEFAERMEGIGATYKPVKEHVLKSPEQAQPDRDRAVPDGPHGRGR